jgi:hypothetical protein
MATDKGRDTGRGKGAARGTGKGKRENGDGEDGDGEPQGPGKHHGGDPVRIHEDYVQRHLGGGAPATPEAHERAIEQFNRLPGAMRVPTTRVTPPRSSPKPDDDESKGDRNEPKESPS